MKKKILVSVHLGNVLIEFKADIVSVILHLSAVSGHIGTFTLQNLKPLKVNLRSNIMKP